MTPIGLLSSFGLERSLTATYNDNRSILELLPGTVPPTGNSRISNSNQHAACGRVERHVLRISLLNIDLIKLIFEIKVFQELEGINN
uniref:Uncharacterized protein n=1 Tax=Setaria digitata TaxID=48799 RepID=A0A915Q648_9BILA